MISLTTPDYLVIAVFLALILFVGLAMSRRAAKNLESYFLGGRKLPWYLLGICGMSNWFDLTGTMIITSFLYMLGPRGLYIEFRGGAVLVLAFMLAYTGKWHRRSGCMTPAEWITYRFGTGFSGEALRLVSAIMGIIMTLGLLAYLVRGATLFMGMVFPFDPVLLTVVILCFASLYTVLAGFYGVVLTDLVQGTIMVIGCIVTSVIAWHVVPDAATLNTVAQKVTGNAQWISSAPTWHTTMPKGYEAYESLVVVAGFYFVRNVLGGLGTGAESRFFAARNSREASLQCLMQGLVVMFRWPLMIGFAIMGIFLVSRVMPDANDAARAADIIHAAQPTLSEGEWHGFISHLAHHPEDGSPALVQGLTTALGTNWQSRLLLVSPRGTVNPELILPAVLLNDFHSGVRGLLIVSLLSALMGVLSSNVNAASALFVRDIYQNFLRPRAKNWELILGAYVSSILIVIASFLLGMAAPSINDLWSWLVMGLSAGGLGPGLLRLYWWRTNAWGMAAGIFLGGLAALLQRCFDPQMAEWMQFTLMTTISFGATIIGSLLTGPTSPEIVRHFYKTTRPFGAWGPYWRELPAATRLVWGREHKFDLLSVASALVWQICLFLVPMQILTHNWMGVACTLPVFLCGCVALYFFWWRHLPSPNEPMDDQLRPGSAVTPMPPGKEESRPALSH
jgi:SSS family solute:Na+ symporter